MKQGRSLWNDDLVGKSFPGIMKMSYAEEYLQGSPHRLEAPGGFFGES